MTDLEEINEDLNEDLEAIKYVGSKTAKKLKDEGYTTMSQIAEANPDELARVGLTRTVARNIIESAKRLTETITELGEREEIRPIEPELAGPIELELLELPDEEGKAIVEEPEPIEPEEKPAKPVAAISIKQRTLNRAMEIPQFRSRVVAYIVEKMF